ncbi:hypothetical protein J421_0052 [Gemmatirosa kalamazoonensis]|uniref:Uncharacterized protein n=1 Tax=Gemmatirosa kalamazoonensis TaxID=861299 RepID=W0RDV7_9BACT|nr:hypothetical protein [Gemmatirosa kalamazoonensis]AHG87545.1 hypothetical protein J421_0007 [Gemmatirosa kalamazoonensis]AHG87568.1 hypothetical protein J421_0030 [Gemmatirosa kalamazoonensis]AHG87589.1 hypothetical protein J421_0052 [Gemmatirosa kalamazoonensis]
MKRYALEIYEPGTTQDVLVYFESDTPFQAISRGDLLGAGAWGGSGYNLGDMLRVVGIEHIVIESSPAPMHKVCVFTENVDDGRAARRGQ